MESGQKLMTTILLLLIGLLGPSARAAESDPLLGTALTRTNDEPRLAFPARQNGMASPIPELVFSRNAPKVQMALSWDARSGISVQASFRGRFKKAGHTLLAGPSLTQVRRDRDGVFTVVADIRSSKQRFTFAMVDPSGKLTREQILILVPRYDYFVQTGQASPRRLFVNAGLGLTSISYNETNAGDETTFSSFSLTPKVSITYLMPSPYWSLGFTGFITGMQLKSSLSSTARFLGLNFRAGYRVPAIPEPWQLTLMVGYYYTTSFVSPGTFGYRNIGGPQLYPTLRRAFRSGDFALAYLKFSPIANSVNILNIDSRELGTGLSYTFAGRSKNPWSAYLDISQIKLDLPAIEFQMSNSSISLGAGYGF